MPIKLLSCRRSQDIEAKVQRVKRNESWTKLKVIHATQDAKLIYDIRRALQILTIITKKYPL